MSDSKENEERVRLKRFVYDENGIEMVIEDGTAAASLIADAFIETLNEMKPENYIEFTLHSKDGQRVSVTASFFEGRSPHHLLSETKAKLAATTKERDGLQRQLDQVLEQVGDIATRLHDFDQQAPAGEVRSQVCEEVVAKLMSLFGF